MVRQPGRPRHRRVEVGHVDDVVAGEDLLRLGERAVAEDRVPPGASARTVVAVSDGCSAADEDVTGAISAVIAIHASRRAGNQIG
jgi:hypothetical protein